MIMSLVCLEDKVGWQLSLVGYRHQMSYNGLWPTDASAIDADTWAADCCIGALYSRVAFVEEDYSTGSIVVLAFVSILAIFMNWNPIEINGGHL